MKLTADRMRHTAEATLTALGSTAAEARLVAGHLVEANLRGHDSHGIGMLPFYVDSVARGTLHPNQPARLLNDQGAVLQFSGERGYGQRVAVEAMRAAIARARQTQVVLMTLSAAHHLGRIGHYGELAARLGFVSIHFVNVIDYDQPLVAPFGGSAPRFGTNPLCIALPGGLREPPFILDFATRMVAYGKTRVAYLAGRRFDTPVMLDAAGQPTADPRAMWESPTGALRPMADHKGSGLVAACELLAGLLSGGGTLQPGNPRAGGILNNMTTILIDPARLADMDWLRQEFDAMAGWIRSSPPATAGQPVQLAGEPERRQQRHERLQWGTGMAEAEWQGIVDAARRAGAQV